jgi:hypothetical protein
VEHRRTRRCPRRRTARLGWMFILARLRRMDEGIALHLASRKDNVTCNEQ